MIHITKEIQELIDKKALFFVSHSGGKDSQAMYSLLSNIIPHDQIVVVHANLGEVEWSGVIDHINENIRHPLNIAKAIYKDGQPKGLLDMVSRRHEQLKAEGKDAAPWPSTSSRYCTSDLKRDPIHKIIRRICKERGVSLAVNCTGMRAQESSFRKKMIPFELCERLTIQTRTVYEWRPIHHLLTEEVFQVIEDSGQKPFWAYADGNERLSCMFCIMGSRSDLNHAARVNPELYKKYVSLERETGYTMFPKETLEERTGIIVSDR